MLRFWTWLVKRLEVSGGASVHVSLSQLRRATDYGDAMLWWAARRWSPTNWTLVQSPGLVTAYY